MIRVKQLGREGGDGSEREAAAGQGTHTPGVWDHIRSVWVDFQPAELSWWVCWPNRPADRQGSRNCSSAFGWVLVVTGGLGTFPCSIWWWQFGFGAGDRAGGGRGSALTSHHQANPSDTNPRELFPPSRSGLVIKEA